MPVPTDTLRNMGRLNRWFAISSIAMLTSILWLIWEDYDRPWRGYQDDYMVAQAGLAHLDYLSTQTDDYQNRLAQARKNKKDAEERVTKQAEEKAVLQQELRAHNDEYDRISLEFGNSDAVLQVLRSRFETARNARGDDSPVTKAALEKMHEQDARVSNLRVEKERIEDAQRALHEKIKEIDKPLTDAQKQLAQLEKVANDAATKEEQYSNVLVKEVINMPLMDFTAPKGTPSREEVKQLVLPEIRSELNYLQSYTTDRCVTCHIAIDNRDFTHESLAKKLERSIPVINEVMKDAPLSFPPVPKLSGEDAPSPDPGKVTQYWDYLSAQQKKAYFDQLLESVNSYLRRSGRKEIKLGQPLLAHPNLDLYVNVDSAHPMTKLGCTVCHEGNPQETDFVQAAHTPVNHHQEEEWKKEHYVTAAFVPNVTFETIEHYWDRPMLPPKYAEAGCSKCHTKIADITTFEGESQAKKINLGRDLFVRTGCINCHNVENLGERPKVGPNLTRLKTKIPREFAEPWIFHPKRFRPSTWMPHFFLQENNGPGSENSSDPDPVLRTETEVSAIAEYLYTVSDTWQPPTPAERLEGDAERGRTLFKDVGCLACHANVAEFGHDMIVQDLQNREGRSERVADALYDEMSYIDRA